MLKRRWTHPRAVVGPTILFVAGLVSCGGEGSPGDTEAEDPLPAPQLSPSAPPGISASNAFYYYDDVESAHDFYTDVLGFETVVDYGFAKIMRVAASSYLMVVDAAEGMHSSDEPKSVTLAIVTEQVEAWYDYLQSRSVPMHSEFTPTEGRAHDGFVAVDPEGYFLEFERFNPHAENTALLPRLAATEALDGIEGTRPSGLTIQATVLWLYYNDVPAAQQFWERTLGVELLVDQGWAKVYPASTTGYIGLVDGTRGLHQATEDKGVTVSFFTDDVDAWMERARAQEIELRTPEIVSESDRVRVFVGYDSEGYFVEWDTFLELEDNTNLLRFLQGS